MHRWGARIKRLRNTLGSWWWHAQPAEENYSCFPNKVEPGG